MTALQNLRTNMKRQRKLQGITQQELAEISGLEYKYVQKIESGRWPGLQLRTIETLAKALKMEAWDLLSPPKNNAE